MPDDAEDAADTKETEVKETEVAAGLADDATKSAEGSRKAALWVATALAAIPTLGIVTSLIRAPGDAGLNAGNLAVGLAAVTLGGALAVGAFARVIKPVRVTDNDLRSDKFDIKRVPGHHYDTGDQLLDRIRDYRSVSAREESDAIDARALADAKEALAEDAAALARKAKEAADAHPRDKTKGQQKIAAQAAAELSRADASRAASAAAAARGTARGWSRQLLAREWIRARAYQLKASDVVANRFEDAMKASAVALGLVAVGVFSLAFAPNPKPADEPDAPTITLVTLRLSPDGERTLGCHGEVPAIKVGGTDDEPLVIVLPTEACPAQVVHFKVSDAVSLGEIQLVEALSPPPVTPVPAPPTPAGS